MGLSTTYDGNSGHVSVLGTAATCRIRGTILQEFWLEEAKSDLETDVFQIGFGSKIQGSEKAVFRFGKECFSIRKMLSSEKGYLDSENESSRSKTPNQKTKLRFGKKCVTPHFPSISIVVVVATVGIVYVLTDISMCVVLTGVYRKDIGDDMLSSHMRCGLCYTVRVFVVRLGKTRERGKLEVSILPKGSVHFGYKITPNLLKHSSSQKFEILRLQIEHASSQRLHEFDFFHLAPPSPLIISFLSLDGFKVLFGRWRTSKVDT
ncbi:hypothetical protein OSB04_012390 [Centaurea solstitialis]|uniref:Uncharacterized protein n=1 Tax=Centaurea solstitialis TaxID=347529 RepID=A0AA38TPB3_9ASTR|nr:hypothetical protein OSB04_012390 [Centaurea solstitialis]